MLITQTHAQVWRACQESLPLMASHLFDVQLAGEKNTSSGSLFVFVSTYCKYGHLWHFIGKCDKETKCGYYQHMRVLIARQDLNAPQGRFVLVRMNKWPARECMRAGE